MCVISLVLVVAFVLSILVVCFMASGVGRVNFDGAF